MLVNTKTTLPDGWMAYAYQVAALSPDPSNQNGAVIIDDAGVLIAQGCNTLMMADFGHGLKKRLEDREWKYAHIEHAERAAVYGLIGKQWTGKLTMITPWAACPDCARAIIQAGIRRVIVHRERMDMTPERWHKSVDTGLEILQRSNVVLDTLAGTLPASITVNGEPWSPFEGAICAQ